MKAMPLKQAQAQLYAVAQRQRPAKFTAYTWKQDRSVSVEYRDGVVTLREQGYENAELTFATAHDMKHALKEAYAREFPRSNKVKVSEQ